MGDHLQGTVVLQHIVVQQHFHHHSQQLLLFSNNNYNSTTTAQILWRTSPADRRNQAPPLARNWLKRIQWEDNKYTFNGNIIGHPITWATQTHIDDHDDTDRIDINAADGGGDAEEEFYAKLTSPMSVSDVSPSKKAKIQEE